MSIEGDPRGCHPLFLSNNQAIVTRTLLPGASVLVSLQVTDHPMVPASRAFRRSASATVVEEFHVFGTHLS